MRKRLLSLTMIAAMAIADTVSVCVRAEDNAVWRYETAGEVSAGGEITVFADGLEGQYTLISAIYCDGILAEVSAKECSGEDKSVSIAVPEEFSKEHLWSLKAFAWDGLSSMKPITDSFEATLTDMDITDKFTDVNFLNAVRDVLGKGEDEAVYMSDVVNVKELAVVNKKIHSLAGIEYFTALEKLDCTENEIEELDVSKNTKLKELYCFFNGLTTLDVSANKELENLDCGYNPDLISLNVSDNPKLITLNCEYSDIVSLKPLNSAELIKIVCYENELEEIDVSNNPKLEILNCGENNLTSLDISNNKNLTYLDCRYNKMKSVDDVKGLNEDGRVTFETFEFLPQKENITDKFTDVNFLNAVREILGKGEDEAIYRSDVSNVKELSVKDKEINSLAGIEYFKALEKLDCTNNKLEELDVSKNTKLKELVCLFNELTTLDVAANKELEKLDCGYVWCLTELNVSDNPKLKELYCEYSSIVSLKPLNSPELVVITCHENELVEIDVSNNPKLEELICYKNNLTSLDVSKNENLTYLDCSYNKMQSTEDVKGWQDIGLTLDKDSFEFNPQKTE